MRISLGSESGRRDSRDWYMTFRERVGGRSKPPSIKATAAWRQAVEMQLSAADFLGAAQMLEQKLARPEEALECLLSAWPRSRQSESGLTEAFNLLGRQAWHDRAAALVTELPSSLRLVGCSLAGALKARGF